MKNQNNKAEAFYSTHTPEYMMASEIRPGDIMKDANGNYSKVENINCIKDNELINSDKDHRTHAIIIFEDNKINLKYNEEFWFLIPNEKTGITKETTGFLYESVIEKCKNSLENKKTQLITKGKKPYTITDGINNRNENVQIYICNDLFGYSIYNDKNEHIESFYKNIRK